MRVVTKAETISDTIRIRRGWRRLAPENEALRTVFLLHGDQLLLRDLSRCSETLIHRHLTQATGSQ